jgi:tRNA threonylcarbamoyladenosine biosynthesis protein TsaB
LLETSQQPGIVAVAAGPRLVGLRRLDEARRHARDLAPAVAALLKEQSWQPRDLAAVAVSRGPGSYTGLRVGMMSAKAFAYATGCRLLILDTFTVIAAQVPPELMRLAVLADAQQDKVYVQEFERKEQTLTAAGTLRIESFGQWAGRQAVPLAVTGPGLRKWARELPPQLRPVETELWNPQAEELLRLALLRYRNNESDDLWTAEPLYLRPSAAEIQWDAKTPVSEA